MTPAPPKDRVCLRHFRIICLAPCLTQRVRRRMGLQKPQWHLPVQSKRSRPGLKPYRDHNLSIHVIGGGLAGCEAAWQLASRGLSVIMHEMRPIRTTEAHTGDALAQLVCSNSLRSDDAQYNAVGLLHEEMRRANSLILAAAEANRVPAGGALAVDRDGFSQTVKDMLEATGLVQIVREEITELPPAEWGPTIMATGPLTSQPLAESLRAATGQESLAFFDAIAPIIHLDSIDLTKAWFQSRYDKGEGKDYINCPLSREQYETFIDTLLAGETMAFHEWEQDTPYFEGCLPIEVMASRGRETLAFGPMKPVGLTDPHGTKPAAIIQLRQDNKLGTLYNMVGFQTKLRHPEQLRIFRTIPGLEQAEFARLGGIHRNTFINGPKVLYGDLKLNSAPHIRMAGQITGCEGYVESSAIGLLAGRFTALEQLGLPNPPPPLTTALGSLLAHVTGIHATQTDYQPMNINFGLMPPPPDRDESGKRIRGRDRKLYASARALADLAGWV